jgi:multiple sugar transport system permease protein
MTQIGIGAGTPGPELVDPSVDFTDEYQGKGPIQWYDYTHRVEQTYRPDNAAATTTKGIIGSILKHIVLVAVSVAMIYPLLWLISRSFMPNDLIFRDVNLLPNPFIWENYSNGWNALMFPFSTYIRNSFIIVVGNIIGQLISCSITAYAFARLKFQLRTPFFVMMLLTVMLPTQVTMIPQYIIWNQLGWLNTFIPLILPSFLATHAFFIFLLVQFIRGIPTELDEAARIDGASHFRIFTSVLLPLMKPALATVTIFTFIWTWNDFMGPLIILTRPQLFTVALALRQFIDPQAGSNWAAMFAMSVITLIPLFVVFLAGQRWLVQGIATTGGK